MSEGSLVVGYQMNLLVVISTKFLISNTFLLQSMIILQIVAHCMHVRRVISGGVDR